jgi:hypothetical protein
MLVSYLRWLFILVRTPKIQKKKKKKSLSNFPELQLQANSNNIKTWRFLQIVEGIKRPSALW